MAHSEVCNTFGQWYMIDGESMAKKLFGAHAQGLSLRGHSRQKKERTDSAPSSRMFLCEIGATKPENPLASSLSFVLVY